VAAGLTGYLPPGCLASWLENNLFRRRETLTFIEVLQNPSFRARETLTFLFLLSSTCWLTCGWLAACLAAAGLTGCLPAGCLAGWLENNSFRRRETLTFCEALRNRSFRRRETLTFAEGLAGWKRALW